MPYTKSSSVIEGFAACSRGLRGLQIPKFWLVENCFWYFRDFFFISYHYVSDAILYCYLRTNLDMNRHSGYSDVIAVLPRTGTVSSRSPRRAESVDELSCSSGERCPFLRLVFLSLVAEHPENTSRAEQNVIVREQTGGTRCHKAFRNAQAEI